jgi:hypothetical protein
VSSHDMTSCVSGAFSGALFKRGALNRRDAAAGKHEGASTSERADAGRFPRPVAALLQMLWSLPCTITYETRAQEVSPKLVHEAGSPPPRKYPIVRVI